MLQRAAALPKLAKQLGVKPFSRASFSEAPAVFDPAMMAAPPVLHASASAMSQRLGRTMHPNHELDRKLRASYSVIGTCERNVCVRTAPKV